MIALLLVACDGQEYLVGASEPVRVHGGVFHEGALPVDDAAITPLVLNAGSVGAIITAGQASMPYSGLATPDSYSVAVAFPTLGTGFWVVLVDGPGVTQENALFFPKPARAMGGFSSSLTRRDVRIDYVQHSVSSMLGLRALKLKR